MASVTFDTVVGGDGSTVTDDDDPSTGLGNGGALLRLVPAFANVVNVAETVVTAATSSLGGASTNSTSSTSLAIGTGSKSFTLNETGKAYTIGQYVIAASGVNPSNNMIGQVTSFSGVSLVVNVLSISGSDTLTDWKISVTGKVLVSGTDIKTVNSTSLLGSGDIAISAGIVGDYTEKWMLENFYNSSQSVTVPSGAKKCRAYVFSVGGNASTTTSGAGGGCAYGEFDVVAGQSVTLTISQAQGGTSKLTYGGINLLTAVGANTTTAGTASKHASIVNGGAYSGGAGQTGASSVGGSSAGSPFGTGKAPTTSTSKFGGCSLTYANNGNVNGAGLGNEAGMFSNQEYTSGSGLDSNAKITDPLINYFKPFSGSATCPYNGSTYTGVIGGSGAGGTHSKTQVGGGNGGFGGGGGSTRTSGATGGKGGFGAGGGCSENGYYGTGGAGGTGGGGGGTGSSAGGAGGEAIIAIFWSAI